MSTSTTSPFTGLEPVDHATLFTNVVQKLAQKEERLKKARSVYERHDLIQAIARLKKSANALTCHIPVDPTEEQVKWIADNVLSLGSLERTAERLFPTFKPSYTWTNRTWNDFALNA